MDTPICDFVKEYSEMHPLRFHMPGHKGRSLIGPENMDITEIGGADVLYRESSSGIIARSEANAARIFGTAKTLYSTEGSSLCIRAMLFLVRLLAERKAPHTRPLVAAGRNAHQTFVTAAALLDLDVEWIYGEAGERGLVSCEIRPETIEKVILEKHPEAVFITSPDYLGNIADIRGIAEVCHSHGCPLLVDNAHGAYLKFMPGADTSMHPMDLGADLCCDSAHKTLPVLTGGAYLHVSAAAPELFCSAAERAMGVFASTSPSWLVLQSLDHVNRMIAGGLGIEYMDTAAAIYVLKKKLRSAGFRLVGEEPLKLTIDAAAYGYRGDELAAFLEEQGIYCEFSDPDYLVLMFTPFNTEGDWTAVSGALPVIPGSTPIPDRAPVPGPGVRALSLREAMFAESEEIPAEASEGRILAAAEVSCPPAVPAAVCGEVISRSAVEVFRYYGIRTVKVVRQHCSGTGTPDSRAET